MSNVDWNARALELKREMDSGKTYSSYDEYQWVRDEYWRCLAKAKGLAQTQINPVGFWHAGMSN